MSLDNRNVLVVDDEYEMRLALREALTREGYMVSTADSGYDAIEQFSNQKFDVVITDIKMAEMNGLDVLKEVKKISQTTPVVMITAYGTIDNAVMAMKEGAFDYILKPFSLGVIENIVSRAILSGNTHLNKEAPSKKAENPIKVKSGEIITKDLKMNKLLDLVKNISRSDSTVLIQGESGTGKELLARYIHSNSNRSQRPFIAVNCAALPEGLLESELFGHEKGAFTGALQKKPGKFELANFGTILLDEVTEMPLILQAKLLRVLQEREIDIVGGKEPLEIDVRVIGTTNRDLKEAIAKGTFREDLYYRLNVMNIKIPPLRERTDDITFLAKYFLQKHSQKIQRKAPDLSRESVSYLTSCRWPGNVRELENSIERAVLLCDSEKVDVSHLKLEDHQDITTDQEDFQGDEELENEPLTVREMEKRLIGKTLKQVDGNRTQAAKLLGISIRTLRNKLNEYKSELAL